MYENRVFMGAHNNKKKKKYLRSCFHVFLKVNIIIVNSTFAWTIILKTNLQISCIFLRNFSYHFHIHLNQ